MSGTNWVEVLAILCTSAVLSKFIDSRKGKDK